MLNQQTLERLYGLKLHGMAAAFQEQLAQPDMADLSFEQRFSLLVDRQCAYRENKRQSLLLKNAKLKLNACLDCRGGLEVCNYLRIALHQSQI